MRLSSFLFPLSVGQLAAQDGGQLYTAYCSACHGVDGTGATGGTFPPLSGSPWVTGPADRAVKIVLHGLEGPVQVAGKSFNLAMPPQGAVLPDESIAAILTYVRSSWGNKAAAVSAEAVKKLRAETETRDKPWTASEILKLHPLETEPSALKNLTSRTYLGSWKDLPDFSKLTAENIEEEHDGIISLDQSTRKTDGFGLVWEADFVASKDGEYMFFLDADDGGRVIVEGKQLAEIRGLGPLNGSRAKTGKITLSKGPHPIRIEYFEATLNQGVQLGWKGPGMKDWKWLSKETAKNAKKWPDIPIIPTAGRAVIYRNFITGTTPRAIAVGFPGGLNLAYSADHLAPELLWTGKFMDGGHHWTDRGQGNEPPAGGQVVNLSKSRAFPETARFKGYSLDPAGNPSFRIQLGDRILTDSWKPATQAGQAALSRSLSLSGQGPPVEIFLSDQVEAQPGGDQEWTLAGKIFIRSEALPPTSRDGKSTLTLPPGQTATLIYRWAK